MHKAVLRESISRIQTQWSTSVIMSHNPRKC